MSAVVYLHPAAVARDMYSVCSTLKTRGYDVPRQVGQRFLIAEPERTRDASVLRLQRVRTFNFWWPRS